jgi:hypothetical protein
MQMAVRFYAGHNRAISRPLSAVAYSIVKEWLRFTVHMQSYNRMVILATQDNDSEM